MSTTLTRLAEADLKYREAKATLERRIRQEVESEMEQLLIARDLLAHQAHQEGRSIAQIGRDGLHTTDRATAYRAIDNGGKYAPKADAAADEPAEFTTNGGNVVFTPTATEIADLLPLIGLDPALYEGTPELQAAEFTVHADGFVESVTPAFGDHGRHPVVALVTMEGSKARGRMIEFAKAAA